MKSILTTLVLIFTCVTLQSQHVDRTNFRAGINAAIITGDFGDFYSFSLGLDILHVWGLSREIDLGLATGFYNAFGEDETISAEGMSISTQFSNLQYIPAAAAIRIYPSYGFKIGGDIGYGIGVSDGFSGGLYYKPVIGIDLNGSTELNASYAVVNDEVNLSMIQLGILFLF